MIKVITNGRIREMVSWVDLPAKEKERFDYLSEDEYLDARFVLYRGDWYDVVDTQMITVSPRHTSFGFNVQADSVLADWDSIITDSVWSAVVFRYPSAVEVMKHDLYADRYSYIIVGRVVI